MGQKRPTNIRQKEWATNSKPLPHSLTHSLTHSLVSFNILTALTITICLLNTLFLIIISFSLKETIIPSEWNILYFDEKNNGKLVALFSCFYMKNVLTRKSKGRQHNNQGKWDKKDQQIFDKKSEQPTRSH
jgi:hypothetical protein